MRLAVASTLLLSMIHAGVSPAATIPRPSPEYGFEAPGGKQVLLSQYKGKVIMLGFYLTTCPHCKDTVRVIEKLYREYGSQGFQPLGVCINDMAKMLTPDFIKEQGATFPIGYGPRDSAYGFLQHPTMLQLYMPTIVMIDRKGQITAQYTGGDLIFGRDLVQREQNFRKLIEDSLRKPGVATAKKASK
ncbi:MAG: TlpA disulfide reductase family protein [Acidobacteriota bacterium]|jgi:peroxiredoxin